MKLTKTILLLGLLFVAGLAQAAPIDTTNKWSWGETIGWMNWNSGVGTAVDVTDTTVTGEVWSERHGWINLSPTLAGVTNTCTGTLGGYAWGEGIGYINMTGVFIDPTTGIFSGTADAGPLGDIKFGGTSFDLETSWRCDASASIDPDNDGFLSVIETAAGSDPLVTSSVPTDTDGDGFPDAIETAAGSDPAVATSVPTDTDGDGFPDYYETTIASPATDPADTSNFPEDPDPLGVDTDGDGYPNWLETAAGSDPNMIGSVPTDTDSDGVPDIVELMQGTDPGPGATAALDYMDTDGDLVPNYIEAQFDNTDASDPKISTNGYLDTDGDLVPDYVEVTRQVNSGESATNENDGAVFIDTDAGGAPDYVEGTLFPNEGLVATEPLTTPGDDTQDTDGQAPDDYTGLMRGTDPRVRSASSGSKKACRDPEALNYKTFGKSDPDRCIYEESTEEKVDNIVKENELDEESDDLVERLRALIAEVLAGKVSVVSATATCPAFTQYMRIGDRDGQRAISQQNTGVSTTISQVARLQSELKTQGHYNGPVTGFFGNQTKAAVNAWQVSHRAQVLDPWGLSGPTGWFYQSSERWMNELKGCEDSVQLDNGVQLN